MPTERDMIGTAERENSRDRPKDAISLMCAVLVVQHRHLLDQDTRIRQLEEKLQALERTW